MASINEIPIPNRKLHAHFIILPFTTQLLDFWPLTGPAEEKARGLYPPPPSNNAVKNLIKVFGRVL